MWSISDCSSENFWTFGLCRLPLLFSPLPKFLKFLALGWVFKAFLDRFLAEPLSLQVEEKKKDQKEKSGGWEQGRKETFWTNASVLQPLFPTSHTCTFLEYRRKVCLHVHLNRENARIQYSWKKVIQFFMFVELKETHLRYLHTLCQEKY